jgi:hypothetical protein
MIALKCKEFHRAIFLQIWNNGKELHWKCKKIIAETVWKKAERKQTDFLIFRYAAWIAVFSFYKNAVLWVIDWLIVITEEHQIDREMQVFA